MKWLIFVFILLLSTSIQAELVVNEVMYNEPEGLTSLEWIELYNNSDTVVNLDAYELDINGSLLSLPSQSISGREYTLLVRKLYKGTGSTSFESYWGNDSDVWGDDPFENTVTEPIELTFSLPNSSGSIELLMNSIPISSFSWDDEGIDGVSFERKYTDSSYFEQSVSREYSTPGGVNSVTPLPFDISLDFVKPYFEGSAPLMIYSFTNRSLDSIGYLSLYLTDSNSYHESIYIPIDSLQFDEPFVETVVVGQPGWMYRDITASLNFIDQDDRPENDTVKLTLIGYLYPPLIISEFYANPPSTFEWIEIYNRSYSIIDLSDWYLGDALQLNRISDTSILLPPHDFAVITQNKEMFEGYYPLLTGNILLVEPLSWSQLNNDTDSIRLVDNYEIQADLIAYQLSTNNEFAYGREFLVAYYPEINRSELMFGTPGYENDLFKFALNDKITINLNSRYYSYGGEPLQISLTFPEAESYSIKIYNKSGQHLLTIVEDERLTRSEYQWAGGNVTGRQLPIGIYIIVVEADGVAKAKETFVIVK
ncbi:MAG: hypothetical protein DWP97_06420 [Calditrichaeota bacterium]|nr:MAG: hypothetical protein DWP97_06420 [Calditrichota bacterium]